MGYVGYIGTERGDLVSITSIEYLQSLVRELVKLPTETEWWSSSAIIKNRS